MNFIPIGNSDYLNTFNRNKNFNDRYNRPTVTPTAGTRELPNDTNRKRALTQSYIETVPAKKKKTFKGPAVIRLHKEIEAFCADVTPSPADKESRAAVVTMVTQAIKSLWSGARVELFGSYVTELYLPTSDIDMVVFGRWSEKPLQTLKQELVKRKICLERDTQVLAKATVPILKIREASTRIKVDISFNMMNGINTAQTIKGYVQEFPALKYLVLVLKQFLYHRDLNEVYTGGLSSYSIILLVVSFLQLHPRGEGRRADLNLAVLLLEFFELYGVNFDYSSLGISVTDGGAYIKRSVESSQGSQEISLYLQDPSDKDNDVAKNSYNMPLIKEAFSHAYHLLSERLMEDRGREEGVELLPLIIPHVPGHRSLNKTF